MRSEDPLPLRKAKISQEAALRKVEKGAKAAEVCKFFFVIWIRLICCVCVCCVMVTDCSHITRAKGDGDGKSRRRGGSIFGGFEKPTRQSLWRCIFNATNVYDFAHVCAQTCGCMRPRVGMYAPVQIHVLHGYILVLLCKFDPKKRFGGWNVSLQRPRGTYLRKRSNLFSFTPSVLIWA